MLRFGLVHEKLKGVLYGGFEEFYLSVTILNLALFSSVGSEQD